MLINSYPYSNSSNSLPSIIIIFLFMLSHAPTAVGYLLIMIYEITVYLLIIGFVSSAWFLVIQGCCCCFLCYYFQACSLVLFMNYYSIHLLDLSIIVILIVILY